MELVSELLEETKDKPWRTDQHRAGFIHIWYFWDS